MREDFLHHVWKYQLFDFQDLVSVQGQSIRLKSSGWHNYDAGPDFQNARVEIDGLQWVGNVEIHINSNDWYKHGHHNDPAYHNVILHVVYDYDGENEQDDFLKNIPVLCLRDRINDDLYQRYLNFLNTDFEIPCHSMIHKVDRIHLEMWMERLFIEKLEEKTEMIQASLDRNLNSWEDSFYEFLAKSFGFKINGFAFEMLAKSLPYKVLQKHKDSLFQVEALLFGQAGMLDGDFEDDYPQKLQREYAFLQKKYQLVPFEKHLWNWLRLRPGNFPTIRIAQFAWLLTYSNSLFSCSIDTDTIDGLRDLFCVQTSPYWDNHYQFDKVSSFRKKLLGSSSIDLLIINTVIPFQFLYSKIHDDRDLMNKTFFLADSIKGESNSTTIAFKEIGVVSATAFRSQALILLKKKYCDKKLCLQCAIGAKLLKTEV